MLRYRLASLALSLLSVNAFAKKPEDLPAPSQAKSVKSTAAPARANKIPTPVKSAPSVKGGSVVKETKALEITGQSQSSRILMMIDEEDLGLEAIRVRKNYRQEVEEMTP
jgi:hypothetical protein